MKGMKRLSAAALGLGVASTLVFAGVATADPSGTPTGNTRPLQGVGSDTTEEVMNALSEVVTIGGNKVIASWNAKGGTFSSRATLPIPGGATTCDYFDNNPGAGQTPARPNGSGAGRTALLNSETDNNAREGCLDFARSSSLSGTAGTALTYIPFAADGLTFAVSSNSNLVRKYSLADLQAMYNCTFPGFSGASPTRRAILPQAGSGTRASMLALVGRTEADYTNPADRICVTDEVDKNGRGDYANNNGVQEHRTNVLDPNSVVILSVAQYIAQVTGTSQSFIGKGVLGSVIGTDGSTSTPFVLNGTLGANSGSSNFTRTVYNVVPTADIADPEIDAVFTGMDSLICLNANLIRAYGFATVGNCGDVNIQRGG